MSRGNGQIEKKIISLLRGTYSSVALTPEMCTAAIYDNDLSSKVARYQSLSKSKSRDYLRDFLLENWLIKNSKKPEKKQYNSVHRALSSLKNKGYIFLVHEHKNFDREDSQYYYGSYCNPIIACDAYARSLNLNVYNIERQSVELLVKPIDEYRFTIPYNLREMAENARFSFIEKLKASPEYFMEHYY